MTIKEQFQDNMVEIQDLVAGNLFRYHRNYYVLTEDDYTAVNLSTGGILAFDSTQNVETVHYDLIIKD